MTPDDAAPVLPHDDWRCMECGMDLRHALHHRACLPPPGDALRLDPDDPVSVARLAKAIDRHHHSIGWDRMCEGDCCALPIARAWAEDGVADR